MLHFEDHNLSVGNRTLDSKHKELLNIVNWMAHLIEVMDPVTLSQAMELFEDKLRACFADEENIAQTVNFCFASHKLSHQRLLEEFRHTRGKLANRNGMLPKIEAQECVTSLKNRLIHHIREDGRPLKIVLDTHYYDLQPDCEQAGSA